MDLLVPSVQKSLKLKIKNVEALSKQTSIGLRSRSKKNEIIEEALVTTSSTASKSEETVEAQSPEHSSQVVTKSDTTGAKEIKTCFCCMWLFPQSFRGEEKNIHLDRCMEGLSDLDKKHWVRCEGDLKQYRHYFQGDLFGGNQKVKSSKTKKATNSKNVTAQVQEEEEKKKKVTLKPTSLLSKRKLPEKQATKTVEKGKKQSEKKDESENVIEIGRLKKIKLNNSQVKNVPVDSKNQGLGYTNIISIPLVTELIFDPSKEFEKLIRK